MLYEVLFQTLKWTSFNHLIGEHCNVNTNCTERKEIYRVNNMQPVFFQLQNNIHCIVKSGTKCT